MACRIGFYHLVHLPLEQALPRLLERVLSAGHRVVVMAGSEERVAFLDNLLWVWKADSWLPHGAVHDGNEQAQPVWLTCKDENPNQADVLLLTDGVVPAGLDGYVRCLTLFDGRDDVQLGEARQLWKRWKDEGHSLTYYQQGEEGGWSEKMTVNGAAQPAADTVQE